MRVLWILVIAISLIVSCAFYEIYRGIFGFSLDPKIKPYEILNLTLTLLIALCLQYYLAGKARDSRAEKDILIGAVKEVIQQLRKARDIVLSCQDGTPITGLKQKEIHSSLRNLANELDNLQFVLDMSDCKDIGEQCRSLLLDFFAYKAAVTGGHFPAAYSRQQISDELKSFRKLHQGLHSLLFDINKHS